MVYTPLVTKETLTKPGLLLGLGILGAGVWLTLNDSMLGILFLGIALFWFGGMLSSTTTPTSGTIRR
jgi:hypothetical protein